MPARGRSSGRARTHRPRHFPPHENHNENRDAAAAYNDLLKHEAATAHPESEQRPLKRRKVQRATPEIGQPSGHAESPASTPARPSPPPDERPEQVIFDDTASASDDSDIDFEDVKLEGDGVSNALPEDHEADQKDLSLELEPRKDAPSRTRAPKRLPSSRVEKQKRIDVHKVHLQCLLSHVYIRSVWCNDSAVKKALRPLMTKKILGLLKKPASRSQFERSDAFKEGLKELSEVFRGAFRINRRGMSRPDWSVMSRGSEKKRRLDDLEGPMTKPDFMRAAGSLEGSRDIGAQLFCALLRSVGIDTRLVCSLQPLPSAAATPAAPSAPEAKPTMTEAEYLASRQREATPPPVPTNPSPSTTTSPQAPTRIKRFGASKSTTQPPASTTTTPKRDLGTAHPSAIRHISHPKKPLLESPSPIFWIEAFSPAYQSWIPCDPLVTRSVAKPRSLEPALHDALNLLSYVVAFEDDGTAKDVTRRYAKAYHAKTRRHRVECTPNGEKWWKRCLKYFHGDLASDRDQVEDAELANLEAREPMPRNVADFREHPVYALERHLRRNEVVWPQKEVGKVGTGRGAGVVEAVYRRGDVKVVKAAGKWYREGREIRTGEQPLKYAVLTQRQRRQMREEEEEGEKGEDEEAGAGLYAVHQTELYVPPPVVGRKIPKNAFGNLDLYVPSMIPPGAAHIRAIEAKQAAKILRVDFADAVTGFSFQGRRGTAVTQGVIVAREYAEAVAETVRSLRYERELEAQEKQTERILGLWRRFLVGLRVLQRVSRHFEDKLTDDGDKSGDVRDRIIEAEEREKQEQEEGGFMLEQDTDITAGHGESRKSTRLADDELNDAPSHMHVRSANILNSGSEVLVVYSPWDRKSDSTPPPKATLPTEQKDSGRDGMMEELFGEDVNGGGGCVQSDGHEENLRNGEEGGGGGGGGGGLLPDVDEGGGGFLADDSKASSPQRADPINDRPPVLKSSTTNLVETAENAMLNLIDHGNEADATDEPDDVKMTGALAPSSEGITTAHQDQQDEAAEPSRPGETHNMPSMQGDDEIGDRTYGSGAEQDDKSSQGSLLSHDPDDEDAEPDWL